MKKHNCWEIEDDFAKKNNIHPWIIISWFRTSARWLSRSCREMQCALKFAVQDVDLSRRKSTEIIYYVIRSITNWLPHIDVMLFLQICVVCMLKSWPIRLPIEILPEFRPLSLHSALSLDHNVVTMQNKFQLSSVIDDTNVTHYSSTQQSACRSRQCAMCEGTFINEMQFNFEWS